MAKFKIHTKTDLSAEKALAQLLDMDIHTKVIPLTVIHHEGEPRVGKEFNARTSIGRFGFDDVMRIEHLVPPTPNQPGEVQIVKTGKVVGGTVNWTITPTSSGSDITWEQDLTFPFVPQFLDPIVAFMGRMAYGQGLQRILKYRN